MASHRRPTALLIALGAIAAAVLLQQIWHWEVERVEVGPGKFLVLIHRWGKDLAPDQIIAPDASYKGVMLDVKSEGRQWVNPLFWTYEVHPWVDVPVGKCLVVSRLFGDRLPAAQILATQDAKNPYRGQRGILRDVLPPGSYRLNPKAYSWIEVPAVEVKVDQVGVRTLKVGRDPRELAIEQRKSQYFVPDGYRGVQETIVPPGTYYINPFVESITPIEVRSHRVELTDIEFPSRDGFIIRPYMVVEYAVRPEIAPEMLVRLTDQGVLHQGDHTPEEQQENEILQKVILPHIRGYARTEGSNFDARDFILIASTEAPGTPKKNNAREALQQALLAKVKPRCKELGVDVRAVTLADMRPPIELSEQISQRELARVEREKNLVRIGQYKAEQDLKGKEALKTQAKEKVEAETRLVQAKTRAQQQKEVEQSRLKQELANAQLKLDAALKQAEAMMAKGRADAEVIHLQNEAEVAGLRQAVSGFDSVEQFAQYHILARLSPALSEVFVSDDSELARILTSYIKPKTNGTKTPTSAGTPTGVASGGR